MAEGIETGDFSRSERLKAWRADTEPWREENSGIQLFEAVEKDQVDYIKKFISLDARTNGHDKLGRTPLHYVSFTSSLKVAKLLLDAGADPNARANAGVTPLCWAAMYQRPGIAQALIEHGGRVNLKTTAYSYVMKRGDNPFGITNVDVGTTALHYAALFGDKVDTARVLINAGANIDTLNAESITPLHWAVYFGHLEVARELLSAGADVNAPRKNGDIPLHYAYSPSMIRMLLNAGADIRKINKAGKMPLDQPRVTRVIQKMKDDKMPAGHSMDEHTTSKESP